MNTVGETTRRSESIDGSLGPPSFHSLENDIRHEQSLRTLTRQVKFLNRSNRTKSRYQLNYSYYSSSKAVRLKISSNWGAYIVSHSLV